MKKWLVASSFLLLLTACGTDDEGTADEPQDDSDQDTVEETEDMDDDEGDDEEGSTVLDENDEGVTVLAEDLETPWNIEENDGTFYITERSTGEIVHVTEDAQESYPVEFSDELYTEIEAGLMGMALAPDFDETNEAFIYYTYGDEDELSTKLLASLLMKKKAYGLKKTYCLTKSLDSGSTVVAVSLLAQTIFFT